MQRPDSAVLVDAGKWHAGPRRSRDSSLLLCHPVGIPFHGSGVNDAGQVAGYNFAMGTTYQDGFVWTKASGMTLVIGSWPPTSIDDINNSGEVVGQVNPDGDITGYATSWKKGVETKLGALGPVDTNPSTDFSSLAAGVNDSGLVVGSSTTGPYRDCFDDENEDCQVHAVLWTSKGVIRDLGTLPRDSHSLAGLLKSTSLARSSVLRGIPLSRNGADNEPPRLPSHRSPLHLDRT